MTVIRSAPAINGQLRRKLQISVYSRMAITASCLPIFSDGNNKARCLYLSSLLDLIGLTRIN
ncbi:MAG: hypothetical protein ACU85E_15285, partial [Gammaproteobacteria bacterium]